MTRWSAITRTRGRRSALAYGSRSTTAAEDDLNRLVHHERGRYSRTDLGERASASPTRETMLLGDVSQRLRWLAAEEGIPRRHQSRRCGSRSTHRRLLA